MNVEENFDQSKWTKEQDKAFEKCLALYAGEPNDRWEKIAAALTGKTRQEIRHHHELLVEDLNSIESGRVPLPSYADSSAKVSKNEDDSAVGESAQTEPGIVQGDSTRARKKLKKASKVEVERRKGIAWTPEEHRKFLKGLETYGKGDWRSISRLSVKSRTPTQVASHAQKYFSRLNSGNKQRKRTSIHDVTCEDEGEMSTPQIPVGEKTITEISTPPPILPSVHVNDDDMPAQFRSITSLMNEASAASTTLSVAEVMSAPQSIGCPTAIPSPPVSVAGVMSSVSMSPPTQAEYGFNAPPLNECSLFDISDVPFL